MDTIFNGICIKCNLKPYHHNDSDMVSRFILFDPFDTKSENTDQEYTQKYINGIVEKIKVYRESNPDTMYEHSEMMKYLIGQYEANNYIIEPNQYWKEHPDEFTELLVTLSPASLAENTKSGTLNPAITSNKDDILHCFYELIQNADDAKASNINICTDNDDILISYEEEHGMNFYQMVALCSINDSTKENDADTIGEKGRGFKTVFMLTDRVEIHSGGYHFGIYVDRVKNKYEIINIDSDNLPENNTTIRLKIADKGKADSIIHDLKDRYGLAGDNAVNAIRNCPILFLKHIRSLNIEGTSEGTSIRYTFDNNGNGQIIHTSDGKENCIHVLKHSYVQEFTPDEIRSYPNSRETNNYTVDIIAPIGIRMGKGRLFVYLPTETDLSVPVLVNMPAFLDDSRKTLGEVNNEHISWNKRLLKDLLESHLKDFYDKLKDNTDIFTMLPDSDSFLTYNGNPYTNDPFADKNYFDADMTNFREYFAANYAVFRTVDGGYCTATEATLPDGIIYSASQQENCGGLYKDYYKEYKSEKPKNTLISYPGNDRDTITSGFIKDHINRFDSDEKGKNNSPARTAAFNACLNTRERREAMFSFFFKEEEKKWKPSKEYNNAEKIFNMYELNIYPVKCENGTDYFSINGKILLSGDELKAPFSYDELQNCHFLVVDGKFPADIGPEPEIIKFDKDKEIFATDKQKNTIELFNTNCTPDNVLIIIRFMRENEADELKNLEATEYFKKLMTKDDNSRWQNFVDNLANIAFAAKEMNK